MSADPREHSARSDTSACGNCRRPQEQARDSSMRCEPAHPGCGPGCRSTGCSAQPHRLETLESPRARPIEDRQQKTRKRTPPKASSAVVRALSFLSTTSETGQHLSPRRSMKNLPASRLLRAGKTTPRTVDVARPDQFPKREMEGHNNSAEASSSRSQCPDSALENNTTMPKPATWRLWNCPSGGARSSKSGSRKWPATTRRPVPSSSTTATRYEPATATDG